MKYEEALKIVNENNLWEEVRTNSISQGDAVVTSRDAELMNYAKDNGIEGNYSDVWKYLEENDLQKEVDKLVQNKFQDAVRARKDIVIDMTNMSVKSRRKWLNTVPKMYSKKAIVFATPYKEVYARNEKRFQETGKNIPNFVIKNMMKGFMMPDYSACDTIEWVF